MNYLKAADRPVLAESGQRTGGPMAASGARPTEVRRGGAGERTAKSLAASYAAPRKLAECDLTKPPRESDLRERLSRCRLSSRGLNGPVAR